LKLNYDKLLSNFAFKISSRHYSSEDGTPADGTFSLLLADDAVLTG
jgi:hypothetical protein